ncbi:hypothetical protein HNR62_000585 [Oceanisphaera litoralis]|uniref:hypothetical protein n=1 Tax=Oceanisphaera litoralis TaxID=225144 RepID=UPI00195D1DF5|nr:hypothetical protein [Oceanisphaera litoralis]MBM7454756.1 hypothetical protein [Oceanisphaera litoralis]
MKYLKILLLFPLCWSAASQAQTIEEIFPYTVQSHDENGSIHVGPGAIISGESKEGKVHFKEVSNTSQGKNKPSCYGHSPCVKVDDFSATTSVDSFEYYEKKEKVEIHNDAYTVKNNKDFDGGKVYIINGDFTVDPQGKAGGEGDGALVFVKGDADIKGSFHGYLYATGDVTIQTSNAFVCGRISSKSLTVWAHAAVDSNGACTYDFGWVDEKPEVTVSAVSNIGYVNGEGGYAAKITIKNSGTAIEQDFKLNYGDGELSYKKVGEAGTYIPLVNGSNHQLPLNTELYIKYNIPASLNLTLDPQIEGQAAQHLTLKFVPYMVEVQSHNDCPPVSNSFVYATHAGCPVLAKAGEEKSVPLDFIFYSVDGSNNEKGAVLSDYTLVIPDNSMVNVNNHALFSLEDEVSFNDVALVQVSIANHCAAYAPDCGDKETQGSSAIIGRTVPASLRVKETIAGDISGDVMYAAQPASVEFNATPGFIVEGLDTKGNPLPSYSGEFAGGLKANSEIILDTRWADVELTDTDLSLTYSELEAGQHRVALNPASLTFIKNKPFAETSLNLPLELAIKEHDKTLGVDEKTTLADKEDTLRFGFLTLEDLELPVGQEGTMPTHLNYYSTDINTVAEDSGFPYVLQSSTPLNVTTMPSPPLRLEVTEQAIDVAAYEKQWSGKVELEVPLWLQPHDGSRLVQPTAQLQFTEELRKRGNDRVFNRREVIR